MNKILENIREAQKWPQSAARDAYLALQFALLREKKINYGYKGVF